MNHLSNLKVSKLTFLFLKHRSSDDIDWSVHSPKYFFDEIKNHDFLKIQFKFSIFTLYSI